MTTDPWVLSPADVLRSLGSGAGGLSAAEAARRLAEHGPNRIGQGPRAGLPALLVRQFTSPIVLILVFATVVSGVLGDLADALIILAIIAMSGLLGFWQERGASAAVAALLAVVRIRAEVVRDGQSSQVPVEEIVPGDVVTLSAGDIVPGDGAVLDSRALLLDEAALTGESFPVEKQPGAVAATEPLSARSNAVFMGTHVVSGTGRVAVVDTGSQTQFGRVSARVAERPPATGFERGMTAFGLLLVRAMVVLVAGIFVINIALQRPLVDSALFSLALAVGLTPQLLPAIVSISLSKGARRMATRRVIVKRLDAIEDFGAMSILCTDKTGTMTSGAVVLHAALGPDGEPSADVRRLAFLNALFQAGFDNPIDAAIVSAGGVDSSGARLVDELPYDFTRRRLSVLVDDAGVRRLITKGALREVLAVCTDAGDRAALTTRFEQLSAQGYRVLAVATRVAPDLTRLSAGDESALTFAGFLVFLDPPKPDVGAVIAELATAGVSVRMITGDNRLAAARVGQLVGLDAAKVLTGRDLAGLDDGQLAAAVADVGIFAEVEPLAKERVIRALRQEGRVVGYMGDGINDAPALHAADVGISVDDGVDVAKDAAAIVLLDKDLRVLLEGVREGRRTFANTMKYVFTTISANFGNVLSMVVAAAVLPFLPLLASQILLVNFLTDMPSTTIATDEVDPEQLDRPAVWDIGFLRTFMIVFGGLSSVFDLLTFVVLRVGFQAGPEVFRSGWFIESVVTELAVIFVLRSRRPFFRSRPGRLLALSSGALALVTLGVIYSPLGGMVDLVPVSMAILLTLVAITAGYVVSSEVAKELFYRRRARLSSPASSG